MKAAALLPRTFSRAVAWVRRHWHRYRRRRLLGHITRVVWVTSAGPRRQG